VRLPGSWSSSISCEALQLARRRRRIVMSIRLTRRWYRVDEFIMFPP
jgi:hypothetical protein